MNLTEEVKKEIVKILKSNGLSESLLPKVEEVMEIRKISYQQVINEFLSESSKPASQRAKTQRQPILNQDNKAFESRINAASETITNRVIQSLIDAEQEGYRRFLSGEFTHPNIDLLNEINDPFPMLESKALSGV